MTVLRVEHSSLWQIVTGYAIKPAHSCFDGQKWRIQSKRELVRPLGMNGRRALLQCKENFMQNTGRTKRAFAPSGPSIRKWHEMLVTTGSVQETPRRRSQPIRSPENVTRVLDHFTDNPHSSLRRAASTLGMSHASVQRMLRTSG